MLRCVAVRRRTWPCATRSNRIALSEPIDVRMRFGQPLPQVRAQPAYQYRGSLYTAAPPVESSMLSEPECSWAVTLARITLVDCSGGDLRAKAHTQAIEATAKERSFKWAHLGRCLLFVDVAWALAGSMSISSAPRRSAFCAILAFRWSSYSLSRIGDRSGEEEGSRRVCFFGLRASALPLAGAIVGDRLLELEVQRRRPFQQRSFDGLFVSFDGNLREVLPFDGLFNFLFLLMESPYPVALHPFYF